MGVSDDVTLPAPNVSDTSDSGNNSGADSSDDGVFDTPEWKLKKSARDTHERINDARGKNGRDRLNWRDDVAAAARVIMHRNSLLRTSSHARSTEASPKVGTTLME